MRDEPPAVGEDGNLQICRPRAYSVAIVVNEFSGSVFAFELDRAETRPSFGGIGESGSVSQDRFMASGYPLRTWRRNRAGVVRSVWRKT